MIIFHSIAILLGGFLMISFIFLFICMIPLYFNQREYEEFGPLQLDLEWLGIR